MREILFRGQMRKKGERVTIGGLPLDGKWIYGGIFAANTKSDRCIITSYDDFKKYPVHADTVGQFTGLTDRNGTKIFEGDIVKYANKIHQVVFEQKNGTAYFGIEISKIETWGFCYNVPVDKMEVIGNVHDNPELLKGD